MIQWMSKLTPEAVAQFGNRKKPGRISVVTDLDTCNTFYVPHNIEHIDFIRSKLRIDDCRRIIPTHIDMILDEGQPRIGELITGTSGVEQGFGVRHTKEDIDVAHNFVYRSVINGEWFFARDYKDTKVYDFTA
jgi:hypothetical protein